MIAAAGNGEDVVARHMHRIEPVRFISQSQLSMTVSSPGVDRAIGTEGQIVEVAGGDGDDISQIAHTSRSFNFEGNLTVGCGSLAQLTELIIAAGPDAAIGSKHKRVGAGVADGDGDEAVAALRG